MFYKSENPALFEKVVEAYNKVCDMHAGEMVTEATKGLYNKVDSTCEKLEQSQLDLITDLIIYSINTSDLTSLAGIEKLTNLESFGLYGVSANQIELYYDEKKKIGDLPTFQSLQKIYKQSQVEDISPLYKCEKLKLFSIANQHNIKSIDLSHWKSLKDCSCVRCSNFEQLLGLEKVEKDLPINFYFASCEKLSDVPNFKQFVLDHDYIYTNGSVPIIMPLNTYNFLLNEHPEWKNDENFINNVSCVWSDGVFSTTTRQSQLMKDRVDQIINTICSPNDSCEAKLYKIYQYICYNCKYDSANLELQKSGKEEGQETDINNPSETLITKDLKRQIRSAYFALWDNKAVCAGISNLFNFMAADIGLKGESVYCRFGANNLENNSIDKNMAIKVDHQISKVTLSGVEYFFDPTNDLKDENEKSDYARYFALSAKQYFDNYNMQFDIDNINARCQYSPVNFGDPYNQFRLREGIVNRKQFNYQKYVQYYSNLPTDIWKHYINDVNEIQEFYQEQSLER